MRARLIDPDGFEAWDPAHPECLAWATPGARAACGGRLPTGRLIPQGDLCITGLWDCGDASGFAFHYVSRRGPHAAWWQEVTRWVRTGARRPETSSPVPAFRNG